MAEHRPSQTAVLVAAYRARATARTPAICCDPWAAALSGELGAELAERFDRAHPPAELFIALRTCFFDLQLMRWSAEREIDQVVLLGAGLDTRAARLGQRCRRFFEVDQPQSQADKLARLATIDRYPSDAATYVPCDFERDDLLARLRQGGFVASRPALVLWEGVTFYLTEPSVRATVSALGRELHPHSVLLFDYFERRMMGNGRAADSVLRSREAVEDLGEPLTFGTDDPLPMLYEAGFRYLETFDFNEICLALTGTYERARELRFQHVALASGVAPAWLDPRSPRSAPP